MPKLLIRWTVGLLVCGALGAASSAFAQGDGPSFAQVAEHDIGFDCPVTTALDSEAGALWVLMNNCGWTGYWLQAYDVNSAVPLLAEPLQLDGIDGDQYSLWAYDTPLGFTAEGALELIMFDLDNQNVIFHIDPATGEVTLQAEAADRLNALLQPYSEYVDMAVFSPDHHYAIPATEDGSLYVVDLTTETLVFQMEADRPQASFAPDSQLLYVALLDDPDQWDSSAALTVYRLSDGTLVQEAALPSGFIYPSPDGRFVAAQIGDDQLGVVDLATGAASAVLPMWEVPHHVTTCLNRASDVSDADFRTSGQLWLAGLQWLPDSSGLLTANSYAGDGAASGIGPCIFNYSRLRQYVVGE